jgi:hypothetical protein
MDIEFEVNGAIYVVTSANVQLLTDRTGDLAPNLKLDIFELGDQFEAGHYRPQPRNIDLPVLIKAGSHDELLSQVRTVLAGVMAGEGTLRFTRGEAIRELLKCYFVGGLTSDGKGIEAAREFKAVLSFRALDPYWYDPTAIIVSFVSSGDDDPTLFFPVPPLYLLPSAVLQSKTINNPGVEAWPVWIITGPGDIISLINQTSGRTFIYSGALEAADMLEIDTRPLYKTVRLNGANAWENVPVASADLWPLAAGNNDILVTVGNSTVHTVVEFHYNPRYVSL